MAEEHRCEKGHQLCANNCGLFGNPATLNLCSKCYLHLCRVHDAADNHHSGATAAVKSTFPAISSTAEVTSPEISVAVVAAAAGKPDEVAVTVPLQGQHVRNRCAGCRRKVGLTGFTCRCGGTFCGAHRYPELHACTFDFKSAGREAIARANPVVKAEKLRKI